MADVYATIAQADETVQRRIADVLELRAADLQQRAMLADYLDDLPLPRDARVLEVVGCGTGAVARTVASRPHVALVAGGRLGETAAQALKDEARRRAERGEFFGHIAYASVIATRGPS
jgi:cyclopropane fatty-acyl-phospholipid synthase-like methyltransferase